MTTTTPSYNQPPSAGGSPGARRSRRRYWLALPAVVAVLAAVLAALPTIASSTWGRTTALAWINDSIPGEIRLDSLSLSWLGGQSLTGLTISDTEGRTIIGLESLTTDLSLLQAVRGRLTFGETVIQRLQADLVFNPDGSSNLTTALGGAAQAPGDEPGGLLIPVTSNIALIDSRVSLTAPGIEPVTLSGLSGALEMADRASPIKLSFGGRSRQGDLEGSITVNGQVTDLFDGDALRPGDARADITANIQDLPVDALDQLAGARGMLSAALGNRATLNVRAEGDAASQNLTLEATTPQAALQVQGRVGDGRFQLSAPATARLVLTPAAADAINQATAGDPGFRLASPIPFHLSVEQLDVPLEPFDLSRIALRAGLDARDPVRLTQIKEIGEASISDLRLVVDSQGVGDALRVKLNGKPQARGEAGSLSVDAEIRNLLDSAGAMQAGRATVRAESAISGIPTTLIDGLLGQDGLLTAALGPVVALDLSVATDGSGNVSMTAAVDAANLQTGPVPFTLGESLSLAEPATINAVMTPELFAAGPGGDRVALRQPAALQATLESLVIPLAPFTYTGMSAGGSATAEAFSLQSPGGALSEIKGARVDFSFDGRDAGRGTLGLNARISSNDQDAGTLSLEMEAGELLGPDGQPSGEALSLNLNGRLEQLPSALVDQLMNMEGLVAATLGPFANIDVNAELENRRGPLSLALDASSTRAQINARIGEQGLTLTEPLVAQLEPTPELARQVLAKIHPIFETTQRAERPIRLEVPADGVLIPLENFDFAGIVVPRMTLDFGTLILESGWLLRGVVGLGHRFGRLESVDKEEFEAWFTPAVVEITDGRIVYTRRLDLLIDRRLHLATWGGADVSSDRADLTLAFMPSTMERVFSITVADDDALRMPISGPLSEPSVDFKKTAADLARLRAQEEVAGENPLAGALLGAVGSKVTGGGGPIPPPSATPLPWAELLEAQDAADAGQPEGRQADNEQRPAETQAEPEKKPSTEEQVIRGLIDIFGKKKEQ